MTANEHWEKVYLTRSSDRLSWHQASPEPSLALLERFGVPASAALVDVGGGASNLVDALLDRGWSDLTVVDLARAALEVSKMRLGERADKVAWIVADVTRWVPDRAYDVWHDRAVFHFLTDEAQRIAYRQALGVGVKPGGLVIMATFAPDGPERCSGLPVCRYDAKALAAEIGPEFELREERRAEHVTPAGHVQPFTWCAFRRTSG